MTVLFWIIGIIAGIYLVLIIPSGLSVFISKMKFKKSLDRPLIEKIIEEYKDSFKKLSKSQLDNIVDKGQREIIERNNNQYSVECSAKKSKKGKYEIIVSVGKFNPVTIGHAVKFEITV